MLQSTRYPAVNPLRSITTKAVVKALCLFLYLAFQKLYKVTVDQIFLHVFAQVLKILGVTHDQSTAYHVQSQEALECFY